MKETREGKKQSRTNKTAGRQERLEDTDIKEMRTSTNYRIIQRSRNRWKKFWRGTTKRNGSKSNINGRKKLQNEEKRERTGRYIVFAT